MLTTTDGIIIRVLATLPEDPKKDDEVVLRLGDTQDEALVPELEVRITRREAAYGTNSTLVYLAGQVADSDIVLMETLLEGDLSNKPLYFIMKHDTQKHEPDIIRFTLESPINMTEPEMEVITNGHF